MISKVVYHWIQDITDCSIKENYDSYNDKVLLNLISESRNQNLKYDF